MTARGPESEGPLKHIHGLAKLYAQETTGGVTHGGSPHQNGLPKTPTIVIAKPSKALKPPVGRNIGNQDKDKRTKQTPVIGNFPEDIARSSSNDRAKALPAHPTKAATTLTEHGLTEKRPPMPSTRKRPIDVARQNNLEKKLGYSLGKTGAFSKAGSQPDISKSTDMVNVLNTVGNGGMLKSCQSMEVLTNLAPPDKSFDNALTPRRKAPQYVPGKVSHGRSLGKLTAVGIRENSTATTTEDPRNYKGSLPDLSQSKLNLLKGNRKSGDRQQALPIPQTSSGHSTPSGIRKIFKAPEFLNRSSSPSLEGPPNLDDGQERPPKYLKEHDEMVLPSKKNDFIKDADRDSYPLPASHVHESILTGSLGNVAFSVKEFVHSEKSRHRKSKAAIGFAFGILFGLIMFVLLLYSLENQWKRALIIAVATTIFVVLGLTLTVRIRCVAILMIPTVCTSEGRGAVYAIIIGLLLSGPIQNVYLNSEETANAMACSFEMAVNHSMDLQEATQRVVNNYVDALGQGAQGLRDSSQTLYNLFTTVENQMDSLDRGLANADELLRNTADACVRTLASARDDCSDEINSAHRSCRSSLSGVPLVDISAVCQVLNVDDVCDVLDIGSDICRTFPVTRVVYLLLDRMKELRETLRVDVEVTSKFDSRQDTNGSFEAIRDAVQAQLQETQAIIKRIFDIAEKILAFSLLWLAIRSYSYYWRYSTKDKFDNFYITEAFKRMDENRKSEGKQHLLPLKKSERRRYVELSSFKLSKPEKGLFKIGLAMAIMHVTIAMLVIVVDYGLYWLLLLLRDHGEFQYTFESMGQTDFVVGGSGFVSEFARWMFSDGLTSASSFSVTIDTTICLPQPTAPDTSNIIVIGILYMFILSTVLCQAYMLRLRRFIAAFFYPERELERTIYLYDEALNKRNNLFRLMRSSMEQRLNEMKRVNDISPLYQLCKRLPCLGDNILKRLRYHNKYCQGCRDEDVHEEFRHCSNGACECIYCEECAQEARNICACGEAIHGGKHEIRRNVDWNAPVVHLNANSYATVVE